MITGEYLFNKYPDYQQEFYLDDKKLFCIACKHVVTANKKSSVDDHLKSKAHHNNKQKLENHKESFQATSSILSEKKEINFDLIKAFAAADIPLEKVEKLRPFF
ncbi:452_t:CDS:1 [Racocetra persica]|uniref:452_t:CDS:1 n=1 Tax=Racocetra persica TaxID=160502 RepID=A0ACA9PH07_9GLOM|nr:452_t:CDS:1 [Racocetra persica]